MAPPMIVAGMALAAAAVSAAGSIAQGQAAKNAGDFNAQIAERDAQIAAEQGKFDRAQIRRQARSAIGTQRAAAAAAGGGLEGSPLLIMAETAAEAELDIQASRFGQTVSQQNSRADAALSRFEGRSARSAGFIGAGASLLGGASRAASAFNGGE